MESDDAGRRGSRDAEAGRDDLPNEPHDEDNQAAASGGPQGPAPSQPQDPQPMTGDPRSQGSRIPAATPKPGIGRIVHYHDLVDGGKHGPTYRRVLPAMITAVHGDSCVNLRIFSIDTGPDRFGSSVMRGTSVGNWDWPPLL